MIDPEDMMPVGDCCICGKYLDHRDMGNCDGCKGAFHWIACGGWGDWDRSEKQLCNDCLKGDDE